MENMKKYARIIDILVQVAFWLIIGTAILGGGMALGAMFKAVTTENVGLADRFTFTWKIGGISMGSSYLVQCPPGMKFILVLMGLVAVCGVVLLLYALRRIHAAMQYLKEGTPFVPEVSSTFLHLGKISIIYGIASNLFELFCSMVLWGMAVRLMNNGGLDEGGNMSVNFTLQFTFIIIGIVLLLFGYIFAYGETLQQQVDETL